MTDIHHAGTFPAVILAAGLSIRMGFPKVLLARDGKLLVESMVQNLRKTGWSRVGVVVSSTWLAEFFHRLELDVDVLINRQPENGMISSLRLALAWAGDNAEGLLTLPVDHPLVSVSTFEKIRSKAHHDVIVIPVYDGRRGHPTWWGRDYWENLKSSIADGGARAILHMPDASILELPVDDEGILHNINTPQDAAKHNLERYET